MVDERIETKPREDLVTTAPKTTKTPNAKPLILGFICTAVCIVGMFLTESEPVVGLWSIGLMIVLLFLGVPVAVSLAIPSLLGVLSVTTTLAVANIWAVAPYNTAASWEFSVLPMFILMGMLLTESGMTTVLYRAAGRWLNWLPGGLGVSTTAAGAALASVSGSTTGMTYALARAGIPEMLSAGYHKRLAVGSILVAGLPGGLIPPSILMVVYAGVAGVAVGPQLMAGTIPGIMVGLLFGFTILLLAILKPSLAGRDRKSNEQSETVTWRLRFRSLAEIAGLPAIAFVLFGGMFSGIFTPTEAGAAAALVTLVIALVYSKGASRLKMIARSAYATVSATAAIFFVIIGSLMLTRLLAVTGLAPMVTTYITDLGLSRIGFLVVMIVLYVIMGMFFDTMSMMLLTVPILIPTLDAYGIELMWFGVFVVFMGEIGQITPPVGILPYIVHTIAKKPEVNKGNPVSLGDVFIGIAWFTPVSVLILILLITFPALTTFLPSLLDGPSAT